VVEHLKIFHAFVSLDGPVRRSYYAEIANIAYRRRMDSVCELKSFAEQGRRPVVDRREGVNVSAELLEIINFASRCPLKR
jgi:hypothetical protein